MSAKSSSSSVRPPAVAGYFYPGDATELRDTVRGLINAVSANDLRLQPNLKAFIVPHAGYVYSGAVAASAYARLRERCVRRVVLIGPSHRVYLSGAALPHALAFATPLGEIEIDTEIKDQLLALPGVIESDAPHALEHSLEVQLPFLQEILGEFTLVPIVLGQASATHVASILSAAWGDEDTLVLASSDLSHYLSYREAQRADEQTNADILNKRPTLTGEQACGAVAVNGLLQFAREKNLNIREIERCNSGDTAGDKARVVGYGAYELYDAE